MDIEELRRQKERLDREREALDRQLAEAERHEKEQAAQGMLQELLRRTVEIDRLKVERQALLEQIRTAAPRLGDFTYGTEDFRLTLAAARVGMKQPDLLDRLLASLAEHQFHLEPRHPRFRIMRGLRPAGGLQVHAKRMVVTASEPVMDAGLLASVEELNGKYPGLAVITWATDRRVRAEVPDRPPEGKYAVAVQFTASDTGTLDAVLPVALRALDHVAAFAEKVDPADVGRLFENVSETA